MTIVPLTLAQANDLIGRLHRHHKPVIGHRFSLGLQVGEEFVGARVVGRPVAQERDRLDTYWREEMRKADAAMAHSWAQVAPLLAAVREWQEAQKVWEEEYEKWRHASGARGIMSKAAVLASARSNDADEALAALVLPEGAV